ncbi:MAG TPA: hypothetical protein VMT64_01270 [Candidatus Binataceae bacterium]|nr:hypothetical protein [Candidatus Binataceae bacterium]
MGNGTIHVCFSRLRHPATVAALAVFFIITTISPFCWSAEKKASPSPRASATPAPDSGFAPPEQNLFEPIVQLATPGSERASRAIQIFDRSLEFQRRIAFHPELSPEVKHVRELVPPRQATLIRAAALYGQENVPWIRLKDGTHEVCVSGVPHGRDYYYTLAKTCGPPEVVQGFSGMFAVKPPEPPVDGAPSSVIGELGGQLLMNTNGLGEFVDMIGAILRETRGDLAPPWDTAPGHFNHHDRAALDRMKRDLPHFWGQVEHYVDLKNYLDEFDSPSGPYVLFNVDATIKEQALKPFPHLYSFYHKVVPAVSGETAIYDSHGHYWMRNGFDHGRITITFMLRHGMLTPFDDHFVPAGDSVSLSEIRHGAYRSVAWVHIQSLSLTFGLDNLSFASDYVRNDGATTLTNRMDAVPALVAPIGIHQVMDMVAGEFMRVLAQGSGGLTTQISTRKRDEGMYDYNGIFRGEYHYSPTLEFLAGFGDSIAKKHNEVVRKEERNLGEELFDAFIADYNSARPKLIAEDAK